MEFAITPYADTPLPIPFWTVAEQNEEDQF